MRVKLEDVCERGSSNLKQSDIIDATGDYPIYGASGYIGNVDFYHQDKPYVAVVKDGAGIGRTTLHPAKSSVIGTMQYLLPKENVLPEYLCYVVRYMHLEKYFTGATIPHIYFKDYKNEQFNLDSLERQAEIVDVLGKCERVIASREDELQKLDELIKARFVELFDINNCEKVPLGECTDFVDYRGHTPELSDEGTIRMINAKSVGKGFFKYVDEYVTEETYDNWMHRGFGYPGDILFVTEGHTFGNVCLIPEDLTKFALGQRVITIKGHKEIQNAFLCSYMQTDMFWKDINTYRTGGTAQGIRSKDLVKVCVPIPPIDHQTEFMSLVKQVDKSKVVAEKNWNIHNICLVA